MQTGDNIEHNVSCLSFNTPSNCYFPPYGQKQQPINNSNCEPATFGDVDYIRAEYKKKYGETTNDIGQLFTFWQSHFATEA